MPELPEVETTRRGIEPHLAGSVIHSVAVRQPSLRWPVPPEVNAMARHTVLAVGRRAKYLLLHCDHGTALVHLGMSGSLRVCPPETPWRPHDHIALTLSTGMELRYHDPRRFGCWLWAGTDWRKHALLASLGPEPLEPIFDAAYLHAACRKTTSPIKSVIMNGKIVVGVGNIYACEALFMTGIHPAMPAARLTRKRSAALVDNIRMVLQRSITQGGTTLRDFVREDNQPGYFKQQLCVYDRKNQPCNICATPIAVITQSNRSTFFCPRCQQS